MIRLRHSIQAGLRHPLLGPLLLLFLALILGFVVLHTVEHGVEGLLFSCAILAAVSLRLVVVLGRTWRASNRQLPVLGRSPPKRRLSRVQASLTPTVHLVRPRRL